MPRQPAAAYVLGVGMTKFIKPRGKVDYTELGFEAGIKAMLDAHINYDDVDQGIACYVYGDSTCGQRVFYQFGMTSIPIYNVNNNCSTGSTGLNMARQMIAFGASDCVLIVGFEKMFPGSLKDFWTDREPPMGTTGKMVSENFGLRSDAPGTAQLFGNAAREYINKYGANADDFVEIARINHKHSQNNPYAQFQDVHTLEDIKNSTMIYEPLTRLQCCPTSDGAAAVVLVSQDFLDKRPHLKSQAVQIMGQHLATDPPQLFSKSAIDLVGYHMTEIAAREAFKQAGITPNDVSVVELHDCFSPNEMFLLNSIGLAPIGKAHELVREGGITYGGKYLINPSGGLISKGHPLGATGLAQCAELVWQLRGWANNRLVQDTETRYALQQNLGLGGASVVTIYQRADGQRMTPVADADVARLTGLGYNPAVQAKGFTETDVARTVSKKHFSSYALQDIQEKVQARF